MTKLLQFLNTSIAFIFTLISILFTMIAWVLLGVGTLLTTGATGLLDLLNTIAGKIYANQLNGTNTNRTQGTKQV